MTMKWTEFNMPWSSSGVVDQSLLPQPPDVSEQEREKFGATQEELLDSCLSDFETLDTLFLNANTWDLTNDERLEKETGIAKMAGLLESFEKMRLVGSIEAWRSSTPEYVAYNAAHKEAWDTLYAEMESKTFVGQKLNKPGTQVEVDGKRYLIGDINQLAGVCDDCVAFAQEVIVTRYRVLLEEYEQGV